MKRIFFVLSVLFLFVFFADSVLAKEIWTIEDERLICYEYKESYPVPPGLSVEIARKLIQGEIPDYVVKWKKETRWVLKPFWLLRKIETIPQTNVSYSNGLWTVEKIPLQKQEKTDWMAILFFLIAPAICILVISIINQSGEFGDKKLFVSYGIFLILVIFNSFIGLFTVGEAGMLVGVFIGMFAGWFAGKHVGAIVGLFPGILVGVIASKFGNDIATIKGYLIVIAAACLFSFIVAKVIKKLQLAKKTTALPIS